jgi:hypothetical protein
LKQWVVRLKALFLRAEVETEFDEELRYHLDRETERRMAAGLAPERARRVALRDFGDPVRLREEARDTWRWRWLDELLHDVRYASRALKRSLGYTTVAALSLGFGIGATTTLFSVIDALDLRPLPYRDADRLVWLGEVRPQADPSCPGCPLRTSPSTAAFWGAQARSFESVMLWSSSDVYVRQGDAVDIMTAGYASAGFFTFLGVDPVFGRDLAADDTISGAEPVVLLSFDAWQTRYGGDRSVLGARFEYYADPALAEPRTGTIVGVLPEHFRFDGDASLWLAFPGGGGSSRSGDAMTRLEVGVPRESAEVEFREIAGRLAATDADRRDGREASMRPLRERLGWGAGRGRLLVFGVTTLVLLIAVGNVAALSLARTMSRRTELSVRSSLGAPPLRPVPPQVGVGVWR